jgi:hypothetical protein
MKNFNFLFVLLALSTIFYSSNTYFSLNDNKESRFYSFSDSLHSPTPQPLTPEQSRLAFRVPEGYHMELVASEPMIAEPVAIAWDGNARMYIAQMETYTQDADGTGTKEKKNEIYHSYL